MCFTATDAAKMDNIEKIKKYLSTTCAALMHFCIYVITPKFTSFKTKCKAMAKHMDAATLCVIVFALCTLFIILLSRFIVDYEDVHRIPSNQSNPTHHHMEFSHTMDDTVTKPSPPNNDVYYDTDIISEAEEVVMEFETIDDLFRPTPFPILSEHSEHSQHTHTVDDVLKPSGTSRTSGTESMDKKLVFNEWVLVHSVQWRDVQIGQVIKLKETKSNRYSTVRVHAIHHQERTVIIEHINCWMFCHETFDMVTSDRMIYLIEPSDADISDMEPMGSGSNHNVQNQEGSQSKSNVLDTDRLYQAIERINENHEDFKEWVEDQVAQIQEHSNPISQMDEIKVNDAMKGVLTDYLDDKMSKLVTMLEHQQNAIQSITENVNRMQYNDYSDSNNTVHSMQWDWESVEERMDSKIESVVRVQMETKFDHLAQQIAEQIAKEMETPSSSGYGGYTNDQVIRGGEDHILDDESHPVDSHEVSHTDWSYRVVSHSKLKGNKHDVLSEYGYWIIHNLFSKWNQQSISATYKPGDCTPLQFDASSNAYITIELYQPVMIRRVSLYHYHSPILTQTAINAAPKDFQIWGSHNLTKWYDLGNFSYDYDGERDTQYFEVEDIVHSNEKDQDQGEVELHDEENGLEQMDVNRTVVSGGSYDDYMNGFKFVAFRLLSNHGGSDYGCIYRLKVFGDAI